MDDPKRRKRAIAVVWLVIFIDFLGFGIVIPSLAYYVAAYPVPDFARAAGAALGVDDPSAIFVGMLQTAYSGLQFFAAPMWGRVSDRVGRKPVLLVSVAGFSMAWLAFAWAPTVLWLVAARGLAGLFGANVSTAQAYMADAFPPERRAKGMGLIGMAFGFGFVLGPLLGALLASDLVVSRVAPSPEAFDTYRRVLPALCAAGLSATAFVTGLFFLVEAREPTGARAGPRPEAHVGHGRFARYLLVYFVVISGFAGIETMFGQFNLQVLGVPQRDNSLLFAAIGVTMAVVQGGLMGRLSRRFGSPNVLRVGLVVLGALMLTYGWQDRLLDGSYSTLLLISIGLSLGISLTNPSVLALVSEAASDDRQGAAMGLTASAATFGRTVGPLLAGVLFARLGPAWPFTVGGLLVWGSLLALPPRPR